MRYREKLIEQKELRRKKRRTAKAYRCMLEATANYLAVLHLTKEYQSNDVAFTSLSAKLTAVVVRNTCSGSVKYALASLCAHTNQELRTATVEYSYLLNSYLAKEFHKLPINFKQVGKQHAICKFNPNR